MWHGNGDKFRGFMFGKEKEFNNKALPFGIYFRTFMRILLDSEMKEISLILISMNLISATWMSAPARVDTLYKYYYCS